MDTDPSASLMPPRRRVRRSRARPASPGARSGSPSAAPTAVPWRPRSSGSGRGGCRWGRKACVSRQSSVVSRQSQSSVTVVSRQSESSVRQSSVAADCPSSSTANCTTDDRRTGTVDYGLRLRLALTTVTDDCRLPTVRIRTLLPVASDADRSRSWAEMDSAAAPMDCRQRRWSPRGSQPPRSRC